MNSVDQNYLMEDPREAERLAEKVDSRMWVDRYLASSCASARRILDVGCGPGVIAHEIAQRYPCAQVTALDASSERLAEATKRFADCPNARAQLGNANRLPFPDETFDFIYCRFLLEYLSNREQAVSEMVRVCKRGGTILLQDLDGQLVWHFPPDHKLEDEMANLLRVLAQKGFDPFVGRKLFGLVHRCGLCNPAVQVDPYHLIVGCASTRELALWELKLDIALPAIASALGGMAPAQALKDRFLKYLRREDTLTYSVLFTVAAMKGTPSSDHQDNRVGPPHSV